MFWSFFIISGLTLNTVVTGLVMTSCDYTRPLHTLNIESSEVGDFDGIRESSAQKDLIENVSTSHRLFDDPIEKDNYQLCEKETSSGVDISIKEVPGYLKANVNENEESV